MTARLPWVSQLSRIIASDETKAIETAEILAEKAGIILEVDTSMSEIDRSSTGYLPHVEHEAAADAFFAVPTISFKGWEPAVDAQHRITTAIRRVLTNHDPAMPIAFVGHGGVGTLLKCHLAKQRIARDYDQPAGGGNLFCFDLAEMRLTCDWTPMESWKGWGL